MKKKKEKPDEWAIYGKNYMKQQQKQNKRYHHFSQSMNF